MLYHRAFAVLIATLALAGIGWQLHINAATTPPLLLRLWKMAQFFTIITNLMVAIHMVMLAAGRKPSGHFSTSITLSIIMVGIIYRVLLAPETPKPAPDWYPDFFVHVAVPILTTIWWLIWGPKDLRLRDLPVWLSLPAAYCIYALIRGAIQGSYPYFFFDIGRFGLANVLINCAGLLVVFSLCGLMLWAVARLFRKAGLV